MAAAWVWHLNGFDLAAYGRDFFARACSAVVELAKQTRFFRNVDPFYGYARRGGHSLLKPLSMTRSIFGIHEVRLRSWQS